MKTLPYTTAARIEHKRVLVGANGLLCREGTYDLAVSKEIKRSYQTLPVHGKIVLDIGGNIGGFARYAALNGAKLVISIEPEESNYQCLQANTAGLNVICLRGCLDRGTGFTKIYLTTGINSGATSQTPRRGRFEQSVPKIDADSILRKYSPESVKMDCEGAEYNIGRADCWPLSVRNVCCEIHIAGFGVTKAQQFVQEYHDWISIRKPIIRENAWHTLGSFQRK